MIGLKRVTKARKGIASHSAIFSGTAIATFFGAISPMTMCRNVMMVRAMMKEIVCNSVSGISTDESPDSIR